MLPLCWFTESQATPHVAGLIATLISHNGNTSPDVMSSTLKSLAVQGALTGIRKFSTSAEAVPWCIQAHIFHQLLVHSMTLRAMTFKFYDVLSLFCCLRTNPHNIFAC